MLLAVDVGNTNVKLGVYDDRLGGSATPAGPVIPTHVINGSANQRR